MLSEPGSIPVGMYAPAAIHLAETFSASLPPFVVRAAFDHRTRAHRLSFRFNRDVSPSLPWGELTVTNLWTGERHPYDALEYNGETNTATLSFDAPLPDGLYLAVLPAGIAGSDGTSMGVPYEHEFFVLTADADRDGRVDAADYYRIDRGRAMGLAGWENGDFDYSGGPPDADDYSVIDAAFLRGLPVATVPAPGFAETAGPAPMASAGLATFATGSPIPSDDDDDGDDDDAVPLLGAGQGLLG